MVHAILALILLLLATGLAVYKPFGMTAYGTRRTDEQRQAFLSTTAVRRAPVPPIVASSTPRWIYIAGLIAVGVALLIVLLHLTGTGFQY